MTILVDDETLEVAAKKADEAQEYLITRFTSGGFDRRGATAVVKAFREAVREEDELSQVG